MNYSAMIQNRRSVHAFREKEVPSEAIGQLRSYYEKTCPRLVPEIATELIVLDKDAQPALESSAGYKQFLIGAPHYLLLMSAPHSYAAINAGYMMEDLVLKLTELDIDTCWMTFTDSDKIKKALSFTTPLEVAAIVAFGYGEKTAKKLRLNILSMSQIDVRAEQQYYAPKKGVHDLVHMGRWSNKSGLDEMMDFYDDMLWQSFYAASLSPSYLNRQPYGFLVQDHSIYLVQQEMFLGIALHLAMNEGSDRMGWVKRFYDMLSRMEVTMATPTMSNARKPYHQLSSCFVDTVPDSLDGIYRSLDNFAKVSKFGGGMGMYFGKVRAAGSTIRGFQGAAGGVIRWIRLVNDTAVAVDQLGMRQGAVAVYLDAWHRDLPEFLQLRTNNGDDRMKAHDVFPAVCYPDLFWRLAEENIDAPWHLMCPHEILTVKGYALEDYWGTEWEKRYLDCVNDPRIEKRSVTVKDIVRLVLRSAVETGTPFAFNRDSVNRMNPNGHTGMIYCSNLCTEIAQNMAPIEHISTEVHTENGDTVVVTATRPGEFVVCNLASLSLGNLPVEDEAYMERTVETAIRALDNVIDLNFYPLEYARLTNQKYRSIGLGVSGYHHMLAKRGIRWESEEHLAFTDAVFEHINYAAVKADAALAREKGRYALFEGSDWQTGAYFEKRGYTSEKWRALAETVAVQGMRNAYLLAVAPTSSTSILSGTSAGIDPIMKKFFLEEKKGSMLPRVAPELSMDTWWYYKAAHLIDQSWSVRAAGLRQRHIDQAQSMNLYITNDYSMRQVLRLYLEAWRVGVKTIYYVRSKALEVEDCESCSS
jgi:ribonucleoside-diphosphate reductase alpha chain